MNRNSTLKCDDVVVKNELKPKAKTIDFLKKFARVYYADGKLSQEFKGTILN